MAARYSLEEKLQQMRTRVNARQEREIVRRKKQLAAKRAEQERLSIAKNRCDELKRLVAAIPIAPLAPFQGAIQPEPQRAHPSRFSDYKPGELYEYEIHSLSKFKPALDGRTPSLPPST